MNPVWASGLGIAILAAIAGLAVWPLAGPVAAWASVAVVLALRVITQTAQLAALFNWLRKPSLRNLPEGSGAWEQVLAELYRHLKRRDVEHEQLLRALRRFRAAGQALPDGVVILDREHRIEWANATAARHLGIDARRDVGQLIVNLVRYPDFVEYLGRGAYDEPLALDATRSGLALSVRVIQFGDERRLLNTRDVTLEERLDTMRRDFIANVSHELKTPVTVLSGFVESLADPELETTPEQRARFLGLMSDQAHRMRRLIEDLLTLSTLESSAAPHDDTAIDMTALLGELAEEARALSGDRHRIEVSDGASAALQASDREVRSALSNLVSNAVRYTPEGGSVRLAWRVVDGRGEFSVQDSGIGIESRHLPRLTERFYRIDSSRSRETGGTGLGLAIVRHVLTRHQAHLDVQSTPGRGSRFTAVFPPERLRPRKDARAAA